MNCRFCNHELSFVFVDLVNSPPSNSLLNREQLNKPETFYPLRLYICDKCFLVQIDEYKNSQDIFNNDYAYFSSYSSSWLEHCEKYTNMIQERLKLNSDSNVVEIASNDGYLLQYFKNKNIPCFGVEPTANTAKVAIDKGIETYVNFFGVDFAKQLVLKKNKADLVIGNNVLAHVPNVNDFVKGLKIILKESGTITLEVPHIMELIKNNQFDTIYHEHFSYLSLNTINKIFTQFGLTIYDVEQLTTHGGSLRVYATHIDNHSIKISSNVEKLLKIEQHLQLDSLNGYKNFQNKVNAIKNDFLKFLLDCQFNGKKVIAYGAAAKGNTLLNYCGIKNDLISFVVDKSPYKQGKYLPSSHIPIVGEEEIIKMKPDYIIILPWNLKDEIVKQLNYTKDWGTKFFVPIPKPEIL